LSYDADSYPYGREQAFVSTSNPIHKFTGKERDTETGNDYFGARYYSSTIGRFMSADWSSVPVAVPYANLTNPQTLNLYAIVRDNPETFADLDGHCGQDWTTPCKNNATVVKGKIPAQGDGPATGDGTSSDPNGAVRCLVMNCTKVAQTVVVHGDTEGHDLWVRAKKTWDMLVHHRPWALNVIFPFVGLGVAADVEWNPETRTRCFGLGAGASVGKTLSFGPLSGGGSFNGKTYPSGADDILSGWSVSGGAISNFLIGVQGMVNNSGYAYGPAVGVPGVSGAVTYSVCGTVK
jgi:RHS repeat-associated protein